MVPCDGKTRWSGVKCAAVGAGCFTGFADGGNGGKSDGGVGEEGEGGRWRTVCQVSELDGGRVRGSGGWRWLSVEVESILDFAGKSASLISSLASPSLSKSNQSIDMGPKR